MNIVQVTHGYPPEIGGVQKVTKELSERLTKKGHKVTVFTAGGRVENTGKNTNNNPEINYLRGIELAHTPIVPLLFFKLLKIPKDSVIHVHIAKAFLPEIVYIVSKIRGVPYIAHVHLDVSPTGRLGFLLPSYKSIILKRVLTSSNHVIVPSEDYKDLINRKYSIPARLISVIPNGIKSKDFQLSVHKLGNPLKLLYVGRLSKQKSIPLLVRSLKKVIAKGNRNMLLHIVGDGEERDEIVDLIVKEDVEGVVILHGELYGESLKKIYSESDIFMLASKEESFGIVLVEAMASGIPIVASNIHGVRNIVKSRITGLLVKRTSECFAEAIEELISNDPLRRKLIKNGKKESEKYHWDRIISKYEVVYSKVAT